MIPLAILMGHEPPLQHQAPESAIRRNVAWLNPTKLPDYHPVERSVAGQRVQAAKLRADILAFLAEEGPAQRGEIQHQFGIDEGRGDYAMQQLRAEGLVDYCRARGWYLKTEEA